MSKEEHIPEDNDIPKDSDAGAEDLDSEKNTEITGEDETGREPDDNPAGSDREVETLQKELAEAKDKYLRLAAEFDNYRKRTLREKTELIQTAGESLLKDILPVMDDFDRGLDAVDNAEDIEPVKVGMGLIYDKLKGFLESNGVKEIAALNEPFDADLHEAVTNIPAPSDDMKGKVVDVIQKGYFLHDKIMRYPKVVVGE